MLINASNLCAATVTCDSTSYADVNAKVSAASNGDTVLVPACVSTWNSMLTIPVGITLKGAGTNDTIILNGANLVMINVDLIASKSGPVRITGFSFHGGQTQYGVSIVDPSTFRVDHNLFTNWYIAINLDYATGVDGVSDHNYILNCQRISRMNRNGQPEWDRFTEPYMGLGTTNTYVMEDNYIKPTSDGMVVSSQYGAHWVFRFNNVTNTLCTDMFDGHGSEGPEAAARGNIFHEVYMNKLSTDYASTGGRIGRFRGGIVMFWSNTIWTAVANNATVSIDEEEAWNTSQAAAYGGVNTSYPRHDQITNSFWWANIANGAAATLIPVVQSDLEASAPGFFQENRDYWLRAPTIGDTIANYTPLTYPHPLVTAQDGIPRSATAISANVGTITRP